MKKLFLLTLVFCDFLLTAQDLRIPTDSTVITTGSISVKEKLIN